MIRITWRRGAGVFAAALAVGCSSTGGAIAAPAHPELDPFREAARAAGCADKANRLFLIDEQLVFWHRAGTCFDASYDLSLYGLSTDELLCALRDSIGGPVRFCDDELSALFDRILESPDEPGLGLRPDHTVEAIRF